MLQEIFEQFVILWVVIDPIGTIPVFVAVTAGIESSKRSGVALHAALIAAGASIYYASTLDNSRNVAVLESAVSALKTKVDTLPDNDGVKQLISDNVTIPPAGPASEPGPWPATRRRPSSSREPSRCSRTGG